MEDLSSFEEFYALKKLCHEVANDCNNEDYINSIKNIIAKSSNTFINVTHAHILSALYPILKKVSEDKKMFSNEHKQNIIETLNELFKKFKLDKKGVFFNIYAFLLSEIYDHEKHIVLNISEEYKLSILDCMTSLAKCLSSEVIFDIYTKENAPKFCQMLYVALEIAKKEQMRSLRIAAVECILAIAQVLDDKDFNDVVIKNQVSEVFLYFIPGIASGLKDIALLDEKVGHKIPVIALKAWGRLVSILMAHYGAPDEPFNMKNLKNILNKEDLKYNNKSRHLESSNDVEEYLNSQKRNSQWYKTADSKMKIMVLGFCKLVYHSHYKVRLELVEMSGLLIEDCYRNIPSTIGNLIEIVISLSEDENDEVKNASKNILSNLSNKFSESQFKTLLENLEEGFFNSINSLPRKFNGIDEREQLSALNLIIGYINLFGKYKLNVVLMSSVHLNKLMTTLIHISELEKTNISLLEEYTVNELDISPDLKTPWKVFRKFKEDSIKNKIEELCSLLAQYGSLNVISDFLLDNFLTNPEERKETIFLLNGLLMGAKNSKDHNNVIKNIINMYTNKKYWYIPVQIKNDEYGFEYTLAEIQDNVILVCLMTEGIGKIALVIEENFNKFMLGTLYLVFERAGSGNPLIKTSGLSALKNISLACKYKNITDLVIKNIDYFSFYVERNLNKIEQNQDVLNVLTVILKYSKIEVLSYISEIIKEVLMQSCDTFKEKYSTGYLRIFHIFIQSIIVWFDVQPKILPIKSKKQKEREEQDFYVSGITKEDFSDEIMNKSAEEMYREDMEKKKIENEELEDEVYKKPDPPLHIKLTVQILGRSLHFLPSKDSSRKLLVLQILNNGLEIIRDWDDELLPIVHQIWSPLVRRFKEFDNSLIINYSFTLLVTLARLSKEFIRMRAQNDVLPSLMEILNKLSIESHLKDKGSAYRYTQAYKLQLNIIHGLGSLLIDLDATDIHFNVAITTIIIYLSDKQPVPLQEVTVNFFELLWKYNPDLINKNVNKWLNNTEYTNCTKNLNIICKKCK
ncbi:unnamed protein product [Brassicogethes aeneus]|uniref:TELO2-interacting protein 1 homolog n=1 Tax=Brassicogethes aeneus TaxID=1431903 RepID=A0A9P0BB31_BRAAE|nr:unnamed protein product [Brassicogethes aeneus]